MEELRNQVISRLDKTLLTTCQSILDKNKIPYNLSNDYSDPDAPFVSFFVANCDLSVSKKNVPKYKLLHPNLDITYSCELTFDYSYLLEKSAKLGSKQILTKLFLIYGDIDKPEWVSPIISKIKTWSKLLFYELMSLYSDKYNITLFRLPFEVFLKNPDNMFISKLPTFKDLTLVEKKSGKLSTINYDNFIGNQVQIIRDMQTFKKS